jgi:hypothetical protein
LESLMTLNSTVKARQDGKMMMIVARKVCTKVLIRYVVNVLFAML